MFGQSSKWQARRAAMVGATICVLAATLALGACGAAAQSANHGPISIDPTSAGTTSAGSIPGGGMAVRPCPGDVSDATQAGALALILTPGNSAGSLRVGEQAQVRLPAALHWTLTSQPTLLSAVGVAGGQDTTLNVCYWTFRAQTAGSETLNFSGAQPCDQPSSCDTSTTPYTFTITVS
jgi:hypothetical protein